MSDPIIVYTDGASRGNPGPGGWGAVLVNTHMGEIIELGGGKPKTTNNITELEAAIASLSFLAPNDSDVEMYVDSKYVIQGITEWVYGWRQNGWKTRDGSPVKNQDQWKLLWVLAQERIERSSLTWHYVPGHSGIPGNERADEIATKFADGLHPKLYRGNIVSYPHQEVANREQLLKLLKQASNKESSSKSSTSKKAFCYVSIVDNEIKTHKTWTECKERVDGKKAKYRKATSKAHLDEIIQSWKSEG